MINQNTPAHQLFTDAKYRMDRWTLIGLAIVCALALISLIIDQNFLLLREFENPSKAVTLLLFTPILIFLTWVCLALLPFSGHPAAAWARVSVYLLFFLVFNF